MRVCEMCEYVFSPKLFPVGNEYCRISGYPASDYPDIQLQIIRISSCRLSGYPAFRLSGYPAFRLSGYPAADYLDMQLQIIQISSARLSGYQAKSVFCQ